MTAVVPSEKPNITVKEGEGARYEDLSSDALQRLFRNTARVASRDALRKPWWVLVHEILAVGSTSARQFCRKANLDPDDKVSAA